MRIFMELFTILMIVSAVVTGLGFLLTHTGWDRVPADYKSVVTVDDSEKIERAVSNAIDDVRSRKFVITKIDVMIDNWSKSRFRIVVGGTDGANLLKIGK